MAPTAAQHDHPAPEHRRLVEPELGDEVGRVLRSVAGVGAVVEAPQPGDDVAPAVAVVRDERRRQQELGEQRPGDERQVRRQQASSTAARRSVRRPDARSRRRRRAGRRRWRTTASALRGARCRRRRRAGRASTRSRVGAIVKRLRSMIRSSHQITTATASMCGNSVSSWSVCRGTPVRVANTAVSARATMRPARRRTMPWYSTSQHAQHGDLDELEAFVVDAPDAHERRQQQRAAPRVDRRRDADRVLWSNRNRLSEMTSAMFPSNRLVACAGTARSRRRWCGRGGGG